MYVVFKLYYSGLFSFMIFIVYLIKWVVFLWSWLCFFLFGELNDLKDVYDWFILFYDGENIIEGNILFRNIMFRRWNFFFIFVILCIKILFVIYEYIKF